MTGKELIKKQKPKIFKPRLNAKPVKVHKDKKKAENKKACRKKIKTN